MRKRKLILRSCYCIRFSWLILLQRRILNLMTQSWVSAQLCRRWGLAGGRPSDCSCSVTTAGLVYRRGLFLPAGKITSLVLRKGQLHFVGSRPFFTTCTLISWILIAVKWGKVPSGVSETWQHYVSLHICALLSRHTAAGDLEFACVVLTVGRPGSVFFSLSCPYPEPPV